VWVSTGLAWWIDAHRYLQAGLWLSHFDGELRLAGHGGHSQQALGSREPGESIVASRYDRRWLTVAHSADFMLAGWDDIGDVAAAKYSAWALPPRTSSSPLVMM
jgi:hypothetical protein